MSNNDFHHLTSEQRSAICYAVGHLSALASEPGHHADNHAAHVRALVTAFGMDHLRRDLALVAECFDREQASA